MSVGLSGPDERFVLTLTKLSMPPVRERYVPRPRLIEVLGTGLSAKATLVCASTGWGKTSVLAEWARACAEARFAWLSLDAADDQPLRFWRYVAAAIGAVAPAAAAAAERRLRGPVVSIAEEILPLLVNDLATIERRLVLVLDDYHLITDSQIHAELTQFIDRMPRTVHLVVAAQGEPRLPLGRLRAMGELAELRDRQLRFSDEEAGALLNRVHGLGLSTQELAAVQGRTEGWVAGLNLAALSLTGREDRQRVLGELPADERFLVDYLWDEVVAAQPRDVRQFLMRTAILTRLTGSLCDTVAEREESEEMLRELERANLFVVALDPAREWFRYHHLFRELLLRQLRRFAPERIADLHRRASTWLAAHGLMVDAIDHAITAGDMHYAADEIERHWLQFYSAGQATALLSLIDRLPAEAIDSHPVLALARGGVARAIGRLEEVEPWLQRAENAGSADAPARGLGSSIESGVALTRAMHRLALGDAPGAVSWGRRALALEPTPGSPEHATAGYFLGIALFYSDAEEAETLLRNYLAVIGAGEHDVRRYFAMALLAEHNAVRGELDTAEQLATEALHVARSAGLEEHPPTEQVHVALGITQLARGRLEAAEEELEQAVALARRGGDRIELAHALAWIARLRIEQRDLADARDTLQRARELAPQAGQAVLQGLVGALEHDVAASAEHPRELKPSTQSLSDAELRVLRLLPSDLSYREIAAELFLSHDTVRTHARRVRHKLSAATRAEAVTRALELGLL